MADHSYGNWTEKDGNEHIRTCSVCNDVESESHNWGAWEIELPDCKNDGKKVSACADCGAKKEEILPSTGDHNFADWKDNGDGTHTGICTGCNTETKTEAHTFSEWTVVKAATCQDQGEEKRTCTKCGAFETREIPVSTQHTYDDTKWTDCGDGKNHEHSCTVCGKAPVKAEHTWDSGKVTTAATCAKDGVMTFACKVCKAVKTEVIPATGKHDYTASYKDNGDGTHTGICACGEENPKPEKHEYTINGDVIEQPTTSKEGKQEKLCVCGAKTEVTLPKKSANLDKVPKTGDITGQIVLGGASICAVLAAAFYLLRRKLAK